MPTLASVGGNSLKAALSSAAPKESETSRELSALGVRTESLHSIINTLAECLAPITQNVPSSAGEAEKRISPVTAIATAIRIQADKVEQATDAIRSIIQRIEL